MATGSGDSQRWGFLDWLGRNLRGLNIALDFGILLKGASIVKEKIMTCEVCGKFDFGDVYIFDCCNKRQCSECWNHVFLNKLPCKSCGKPLGKQIPMHKNFIT
jgi:hypothetical protein